MYFMVLNSEKISAIVMLVNSYSVSQVCFFRQFFGSVTKVDYMTLRHGFIVVSKTCEIEIASNPLFI